MPHSAQPQHTNDWAPRTRKRHQQEHRPQRPTERSDPAQHAKGRTGDCPGPRKGAATRRNVTRGGGGGALCETSAVLGPFPPMAMASWATPPPPAPPGHRPKTRLCAHNRPPSSGPCDTFAGGTVFLMWPRGGGGGGVTAQGPDQETRPKLYSGAHRAPRARCAERVANATAGATVPPDAGRLGFPRSPKAQIRR